MCRSRLAAERQQVPSEPPYQRPRKGVERSDEERVEHQPFPAAMETRLHRKALLDDADVAKYLEQPAELAGAVLGDHRSVFMLERHFHQLRERIQPRDAVVDLEHCLTAG